MRKRIWSMFIVLCFVAVGLAFTPTTQATATPTWPLMYDHVRISDITAHDNGNMSVLTCGANPSYPNAFYQDASGAVRNHLPSVLPMQWQCNPSSGFGEVSVNGTFYY